MSATPLALELLEKEIFARQEKLDGDLHQLSFAKANLDEAIKRLEPIQAEYDRQVSLIADRRAELAQYQAEANALRAVVDNPVAEALDELEPADPNQGSDSVSDLPVGVPEEDGESLDMEQFLEGK